jgi:hypothetical protein
MGDFTPDIFASGKADAANATCTFKGTKTIGGVPL